MLRAKSTSGYLRLSHPGRRAVLRFLLFSLLWSVLSGFDTVSWIVGFPAVLVAVCWSLKLAPSSYWPLNWAGAWYFFPFFLQQSSHGGIDVMRRALSNRLPINPGLVDYTTFLPEGAPRILFVNTISLLPGTLSADLQEDRVIIHTIDKDLPIWANIQKLEWRIAALFRTHPKKGREDELDS